MISRVLIANRGEIALRIIRACKELDLETVAVYSEADRDSSYLHFADEAVCIGKAPSAESYLNIPRIIAAAEITDVDAIHPGYGFLAENAHFAEICRDCKIKFVGPTVENMELLGDKIKAKELARKVDVPTTPSSDGAVASVDEACSFAADIGYPVVLKAAAGGGGRGIRYAHNEATLKSIFHQAVSEAEAAFGDGRVFMEKCIENFQHMEVQIFGDEHGNVIHFWERECSAQRRSQKVIEQTPAPAIDDEKRTSICEASARLVREAGYQNAGTVEYIYDKDGNFYFMEVNTRIQVEHCVTEMVTGVDLVKLQFRVAMGEKLGLAQEEVKQEGVALECRINAEDPYNGFRPSPGPVEHFCPPGGLGIRWDSHVYQGYVIPPTYDSMIGKLIVHRPNRADTLAAARRALDEFIIRPTKTTIPLCREILSHEKFVEGRWDTKMIERELIP